MILQSRNAEDPSSFHFRRVLLAGKIKRSVRVLLELLSWYFANVESIDPRFVHHYKYCMVTCISPGTSPTLDFLCSVTADAIGNDMALVEIDALESLIYQR